MYTLTRLCTSVCSSVSHECGKLPVKISTIENGRERDHDLTRNHFTAAGSYEVVVEIVSGFCSLYFNRRGRQKLLSEFQGWYFCCRRSLAMKMLRDQLVLKHWRGPPDLGWRTQQIYCHNLNKIHGLKKVFNFKSTQIFKMYNNCFWISSTCGPGRKGAGYGQKRGRGFNKHRKKDWRQDPLRGTPIGQS